MSLLEQMQADGRNVKRLKNGAIYDMDNGRIVANPGGGSHAITSDTASGFLARRRAVGLRSQLRGMVRGAGYDLTDSEIDEITDELLAKSGSALEAVTAHMVHTFLTSKNLRGMGEVYDKLTAPLVGDRRQNESSDEPMDGANVVVYLAQYIEQHYHNADTRNANGAIVDVESTE